MQLEWIDDILAVLDGGSLAHAAEKRHLSQSAFTRRVRAIENNIGATLFDRRRKPVTLMPGVQAIEPELRDLSTRLHQLRRTLETSSDQSGKSLAIVCQHALAATASPQIVHSLTKHGETSIRVRSGNQDECLMKLLSREVDFAVMYSLDDEMTPENSKAFEAVTIGADMLIPVCAPAMSKAASRAVIPILAYPSEVFLGQVFARMIRPRIPMGCTTLSIAETALSLAMLELAQSGIGVAWLPQSLVTNHLAEGKLVRVDDVLPAQALNIKIIRLSEAHTEQSDKTWQELSKQLVLSAKAQPSFLSGSNLEG